jgi:hypothetical protein
MLPHFAQLIVMTAHANAAIRGMHASKPLALHPVFGGYRWLLFAEEREDGSRPELLFATPEDWFGDLVSRQARRLRIHRFPTHYPTSDRISAASVGGGGEWIVEVMLPAGKSELWSAGAPAPESIRPSPVPAFRSLRGWLGQFLPSRKQAGRDDDCLTWWRYNRVETAAEEPAPPIGEAHAGFAKALEDIEAFAEAHAPEWKGNFSRALAALTSPTPEAPAFNPNRPRYAYAPEGALPLPARQILQAAMAAWVFGGMGSWNDIWCETGEEDRAYKQVSDAMYEALCDAAVSAANWMPDGDKA